MVRQNLAKRCQSNYLILLLHLMLQCLVIVHLFGSFT
uniref:Uncharacterized protein n=1 Tax=Arundo donax TaxID=35708 RepID=A0A0A8Y695_ARUDO